MLPSKNVSCEIFNYDLLLLTCNSNVHHFVVHLYWTCWIIYQRIDFLNTPPQPYFSQLARSRRAEQSIFQLFELDGTEALGSCLRINPCSDNAPDLSKCSIQWYRLSSDGGKKELISGSYLQSCFSSGCFEQLNKTQ
jgi:hypothetical protein